MKKKSLILLSAILCLTAVLSIGSVCAFADTDGGIGSALLTVTGSAAVHAEADRCSFSGSIHAIANDMNTAEQKCEELAKKIREAFAPYGSVQEDCSNASPVHRQNGYNASKHFTFTTEQLDKLSEIRAALASAGLTCIDGPTFRCKSDEEYRAQALRQAIEDARAKAAALGSTGDIIGVEELSCYPGCRECRECDAKHCVTYTATVRVAFAALPNNG